MIRARVDHQKACWVLAGDRKYLGDGYHPEHPDGCVLIADHIADHRQEHREKSMHGQVRLHHPLLQSVISPLLSSVTARYYFRWPDLTARKMYYVFHLLVADLLVPLIIMCVAYGLIAKTLWTGFKTMNAIGK